MLGNVVRDMTPLERNGESADERRGGDSPAPKRPRRPRRGPVLEKGKGRNLKIGDTIFRRLELEAVRLRVSNSQLVARILDRELPRDIRVIVGDDTAAAE